MCKFFCCEVTIIMRTGILLFSLSARKCNANASRGGEGTQGAGGDGVKRRVMPGGDVVQQTLQGAVGESISIEGLGARVHCKPWLYPVLVHHDELVRRLNFLSQVKVIVMKYHQLCFFLYFLSVVPIVVVVVVVVVLLLMLNFERQNEVTSEPPHPRDGSLANLAPAAS